MEYYLWLFVDQTKQQRIKNVIFIVCIHEILDLELQKLHLFTLKIDCEYIYDFEINNLIYVFFFFFSLNNVSFFTIDLPYRNSCWLNNDFSSKSLQLPKIQFSLFIIIILELLMFFGSVYYHRNNNTIVSCTQFTENIFIYKKRF